ncbi:MAG: CDGSH iron-sulfur domain-containing protein [Rhodothermales bacterium]|nr:CDGSH iron-sulfur domain-containing protein [Rhodothermales bacterium]
MVEVGEDGPFYVTGNVEVRSADGALLSKETRVALCRCGLSSNKPFCDNSHEKGEFVDDGYLGEGGIKLTPGLTDSVLTVTLSENGPILLAGEVRVVGSDGEERSGTRSALCRCGHSNNKPFCDGTHRAVDFVS